MAKDTRPSRLNPAYLAGRHAGALFLCLALGGSLGLGLGDLSQPSARRGGSEIRLFLAPAPAPDLGFDWDARLSEWRGLAENRRELALLNNNLRRTAKLALTAPGAAPADDPGNPLAGFAAGREYYPNLLPRWLASALGEPIRIGPRDIALNLDFQTLAAIAGDLSGPRGGGSWGLPAAPPPGTGPAGDFTADPDGGDYPFQVFAAFQAALRGRDGKASPEEAWRATAEEVAERLEIEAKFPGEGGFGRLARLELAREIAAIPLLLANGLYLAYGAGSGDEAFFRDFPAWREIWRRGAGLELRLDSGVSGRLTADLTRELHPLSAPRDLAATRLASLAASVWLAHLAAREAVRERGEPEAPSPEPPAAIVPEAGEDKPEPVSRTAAEEARAGLRKKIADLENALRQARIRRDAARLRLETARDREARLAGDRDAARARADRLGESRAALLAAAESRRSAVPEEAAALSRTRDDLLERLEQLLAYCTEEHPFVKQARRELAAAEARLAGKFGDPASRRQPIREPEGLDGLQLEWETAAAAADGLEERHRRQAAELENAVSAMSPAENALSGAEADLENARNEWLALPPPPVRAAAEPVEVKRRPPAAPPPAAAPAARPKVVFPDPPVAVPAPKLPPDYGTAARGLLAGLAAGLAWIVIRELLTRRFATASEAGRLVGLPILFALPAYGAPSLRQAAKLSKGLLRGSRSGGLTFIPAPLDTDEPPPAAKRGRARPARRFPRILSWLAGLLLAAAAALVHFSAASGFPVLGSYPEPAALSEIIRSPDTGGGARGDSP